MDETKSRKPVFQDYYTEEDYEEVMLKLPEIIKEINRRAGDLLEPTIQEKREVMSVIKDFIRDKGRKVYGGTAIDEAIKLKSPADGIYDDYSFSDIEFYSPTPIPDLVELTNLLYEKGYKHPSASEAQHEETYSIFVNFQLYCDISYMPLRVYNGIKTIVIDGINYVDPHFILIDQLRILNQPLTAAEQRWEKTFKRVYKLLKYYPLEYFDKQIRIPKPSKEIQSLMSIIKNDFLRMDEIRDTSLICGFEAYNFYIRHAMQDRTIDQMARTTVGANRLQGFLANVPYLEIVSVNYRENVDLLYEFVKGKVKDASLLTIEEYFPLSQLIGFSVVINYNNEPLIKVYNADGFCVPNVKTTKGYMYVSYQYTLMFMLICKFRAHLDKNRQMYFNYGIAVSNLVSARNYFLNKRNIGVINNTVFGEFRASCIGSTVSFKRMGLVRGLERYKAGKKQFRYAPQDFFAQSKESQEKFDPSRHNFSNTSGNKINNPKNLIFKLDAEGNIINSDSAESTDTTESTETNESNETTDTTQSRPTPITDMNIDATTSTDRLTMDSTGDYN